MREVNPNTKIIYGDDLCICDCFNEIGFYYWTKKYQPDTEIIKRTVNGLLYNGNITGCDLDRVLMGEIRVFLNPVYHNEKDHSQVISRIEKSIQDTNITIPG